MNPVTNRASIMKAFAFFVLCLLAASANSASTVAHVTNRVCNEGSAVTVTCSFNGTPRFGITVGDIEIVKFVSHLPFTAENSSELTEFTDSPSTQPLALVHSADWTLLSPWMDYPLRYNRTVLHNDTSIGVHIAYTTAEDSGYYGCKLESQYSAFQPLLVYAKAMLVNGTQLTGAESAPDAARIGSEAAVQYDGARVIDARVSVRLAAPYASLPLAARLFSGSNVTVYTVVPNMPEQHCSHIGAMCQWTVSILVQVIIPVSPELHLDRLTLAVSRPGDPHPQSPPLWRADFRLVDGARSLRSAGVTNSSVTCLAGQDPLRPLIRVRHAAPLTVECSVPRLWLSLPGYSAYWTVESSIQFYPVGRVACAYPTPPAAVSAPSPVAAVDDPPGLPGACRGNRFAGLLDAKLQLADGTGARVVYRYIVPAAYYVHAGRLVTFRVAVEPESPFSLPPEPAVTFRMDVEAEPKSCSRLAIDFWLMPLTALFPALLVN